MEKNNKAIEQKRDYDILNMLNSISNFEIFTPFEITQSMVSLLPEEVFIHPEYKFLDPCVKSGIFLREIAYKLYEKLPRIKYTDPLSGLEYDLSDKRERTNHILRNMIYGIAISELTAYVTRRTIYGVMEANVEKVDEYLESKILAHKDEELLELNDYYNHTIFNTKDREGFESEGNIFYPINESNIKNEDVFHPFIHETKHKLINNIKENKMKFDLIIGNPPYQVSDGGASASAKPIYQLFIQKSIDLEPKYITMITPSRWFVGGKGLNSFRDFMIKDSRLKEIYDFKNAKECFSGVDVKGGVNYFLWDKNHKGDCVIHNMKNSYSFSSAKRSIVEKGLDYIIRDNESISIFQKVSIKNEISFSSIVSERKPFGFNTSFRSKKNECASRIKIYQTKSIGYIDRVDVPKNKENIDKYKIFIPKAIGKGDPTEDVFKPIIGKPNECCTETYILIGPFDNKEEALNVYSYIKTKFFHFLVSLKKISQDSTRKVYELVPIQDFSKSWTDSELYEKYGLNQEEIDYIESLIPDRAKG